LSKINAHVNVTSLYLARALCNKCLSRECYIIVSRELSSEINVYVNVTSALE
jgi:hypothetical protein